jgi:hypothetical protein
MSYLAVDLDAKTAMPKVARAAGLSVGDVAWGLMELWEHAWREKTDVATGPVLAGCFGGGAATTDALVAFGFLEPTQDGYRICGASRYLRVQEARSKGGKASSGNLKRGPQKARQPGSTPGSLPAAAGDQPGSVPGSAPALTASSEQRINYIAGKKPPAPDSDYQKLVGELFDVFAKVRAGARYRPSEADWDALKALRKTETPEAITARWAKGLALEKFPGISTLAELRQRWNNLAAVATPAASRRWDGGSDYDTPAKVYR